MKNKNVLKIFTLLVFSFFCVIGSLAQEVEVTPGYVTLRNGTGTAYMNNAGIFQIHQASASSYKRACESRVHHYRAICFQALDGNWNNVFRVYGDGTVEQNAVAIHSDSTLKESISDLGSQIDNLMKVKSKSYKLKSNKNKEPEDDKLSFGFLAQDLEKVYPDMVFTNDSGVKSIFYTELIPVLFQVTQEQQALIEAQAKQLSDIEKRLIKLEKN